MSSEATLNTEFGEITISQSDGYWDDRITLAVGDRDVNIVSAGKDEDVDEAVIEPGYMRGHQTEADLDALIVLFKFGRQVIGLLNEAMADEIAAAKAEEERAEAEAAQKAEERKQVVDAREEQLLMELVGERVKVRHAGYKSFTEARVGAQEDHRPGHEGEYHVTLERYGNHEAIYSRGSRNIQDWRRLDVKTAKGWRNVWDDGKDDLPMYDRGKDAPQYQPYKEGF